MWNAFCTALLACIALIGSPAWIHCRIHIDLFRVSHLRIKKWQPRKYHIKTYKHTLSAFCSGTFRRQTNCFINLLYSRMFKERSFSRAFLVWQVLVQKCPRCVCCAADFCTCFACHSDEAGTHMKLTACIAQGQTYLRMACSLMWPTGLKE